MEIQNSIVIFLWKYYFICDGQGYLFYALNHVFYKITNYKSVLYIQITIFHLEISRISIVQKPIFYCLKTVYIKVMDNFVLKKKVGDN